MPIEDLHIPEKFSKEYDWDADRQNWLELERWASRLSTSISVPNFSFFVACSDAQDWEKAAASVVLAGSGDEVAINLLLTTYPGCTINFSTGTVRTAASIVMTEGSILQGTWVATVGTPFYAPTTISFEGAGASYVGGVSGRCGINSQAPGMQIRRLKFAHLWTGVTVHNVFFAGGNQSDRQVYEQLDVTAFTNVWDCATARPTQAVVRDIYDPGGTANAFLDAESKAFNTSVFINVRGITFTQTNLFNSLICYVNGLTSTTPINGNTILPAASYPPSGAAGGDLTGTYPNPTIGSNKVTNAQLAQAATLTLKGNNTGGTANEADLTVAQVKTMLGIPGAGLDTTAVHSGDAAGGALGGTYPNPTLANALLTARVTSDVTHTQSSVAFEDVTGLLVPIGASATEVWWFDGWLLITAANTTVDYQFKFTVPSGATMKWGANGTPGNNVNSWGHTIAANTPNALLGAAGSLIGGTANAQIGLGISGLIIGGGTAGNVQLQFAQNTSDASNLVVNTLSHLVFRKLIA